MLWGGELRSLKLSEDVFRREFAECNLIRKLRFYIDFIRRVCSYSGVRCLAAAGAGFHLADSGLGPRKTGIDCSKVVVLS